MKLIVSNAAYWDLQQIYLFIADDNQKLAESTIDEIRRRFETLRRFPFLGRPRSDLGEGLRQLKTKQYLTFYRVETDSIQILRILHSRMDIEAELLH